MVRAVPDRDGFVAAMQDADIGADAASAASVATGPVQFARGAAAGPARALVPVGLAGGACGRQGHRRPEAAPPGRGPAGRPPRGFEAAENGYMMSQIAAAPPEKPEIDRMS
ncbi:hypothetical protein [Roseivivax sp. CAU 1753]